MKMSSFFLTSACITRTSVAFISPALLPLRLSKKGLDKITTSQRWSSTASNDIAASLSTGVPRVETFQEVISKHGVPGSIGCATKDDLEPIPADRFTTNEGRQEFANLHPHLYPLAQSKSTGNLICGLRQPREPDQKENNGPWPIMESTLEGPGMRLLCLNNEDLMRRIVCECDFSGENTDLIGVFNSGITNGFPPYERGSVEKLGYGVDKYVLLRVGPFADIYHALALEHEKKGSEQSALISAEAANGKLTGFGSTFLFYARLLSRFPNREDETRDAARNCLRLPLATAGLSKLDLRDVALLGQMADGSTPTEEVYAKLANMYELLKEHEGGEDPDKPKSPRVIALEKAGYLLDVTAMAGRPYGEIRSELAQLYREAGQDDMATFVELEV
eukprot:Nitzschia sp. Nitz4//scaffold350_size17454//5085//6397//NITZ4_008818-RA/size17454-augustus-gene-0.23-mRNA-1//1//CDS//3329548868//3620//frame0